MCDKDVCNRRRQRGSGRDTPNTKIYVFYRKSQKFAKSQFICQYLQEHAMLECFWMVESHLESWCSFDYVYLEQDKQFCSSWLRHGLRAYTNVLSPRRSHVTTASIIVTRLDVCDELCAQSYSKITKIRFFFHLLRLPVKKLSPMQPQSVRLFVCRSERIDAPSFGIARGIQRFRQAVFACCRKLGPRLAWCVWAGSREIRVAAVGGL